MSYLTITHDTAQDLVWAGINRIGQVVHPDLIPPDVDSEDRDVWVADWEFQVDLVASRRARLAEAIGALRGYHVTVLEMPYGSSGDLWTHTHDGETGGEECVEEQIWQAAWRVTVASLRGDEIPYKVEA